VRENEASLCAKTIAVEPHLIKQRNAVDHCGNRVIPSAHSITSEDAHRSLLSSHLVEYLYVS